MLVSSFHLRVPSTLPTVAGRESGTALETGNWDEIRTDSNLISVINPCDTFCCYCCHREGGSFVGWPGNDTLF